MSRVSVILTSYNAGQYLEQAIQSVLEQTYADWELVVMDDGSDDETTLKVLAAFAPDMRIGVHRWLTSDATRAASVRYATLLNWGAQHTTGRYLTFLCGDDYYLPDRLEAMVATLDLYYERVSTRYGSWVAYGAQRMLKDEVEFGIRPANDLLTDAYHKVDLNSVMVTRAAFDAVGGFPDTPPTPQLWREADAHFWRRLTDAGYVFVPVPGGPTDVKRYRKNSVDERVKVGLTPW